MGNPMYERERLKAVEELMIAVLKRDPASLEALLAEALEPVRFFDPDYPDRSAEDRAEAKEQLLFLQNTKAAKSQLIKRARFPDGPPKESQGG